MLSDIFMELHEAHVLLPRKKKGLNHFRRIFEGDRKHTGDFGISLASSGVKGPAVSGMLQSKHPLHPGHNLMT